MAETIASLKAENETLKQQLAAKERLLATARETYLVQQALIGALKDLASVRGK